MPMQACRLWPLLGKHSRKKNGSLFSPIPLLWPVCLTDNFFRFCEEQLINNQRTYAPDLHCLLKSALMTADTFRANWFFIILLRIYVCPPQHLAHRIIANPMPERPSDYEITAHCIPPFLLLPIWLRVVAHRCSPLQFSRTSETGWNAFIEIRARGRGEKNAQNRASRSNNGTRQAPLDALNECLSNRC